MSRSAVLLEWLRKTLADRGLAVGPLAARSGIERRRLRRILSGSADMTVEELLALTESLDLSPADFGLDSVPEGAADLPLAPALSSVDPWGNHIEQLFQIGFGLGCDLLFIADASQLEASGIPAAVLAGYEGRDMPIKLDAAYHKYNQPLYDATAITLTLSFDALYECRFPWSAIKQVIFYPLYEAPEESGEDIPAAPDEPTPSGGSHLRLVT